MVWRKKRPKARREQQRRSTERKKATATATPLEVTADPPSTLNNNGKKRKTTWEKRNQERRAKEKALSKQTGSPSSDEDVFGDLDLLYDLDATSDRELDENFCDAPPQWPSVEFEICADFGFDSDLGLDLDVHPHPDMVVQQLPEPELEAIIPDTELEADVAGRSEITTPELGKIYQLHLLYPTFFPIPLITDEVGKGFIILIIRVSDTIQLIWM
jgi:hypothetical protein